MESRFSKGKKKKNLRRCPPLFSTLSCIKLPARQNPREGFCFGALTSLTFNKWTQAHMHVDPHTHFTMQKTIFGSKQYVWLLCYCAQKWCQHITAFSTQNIKSLSFKVTILQEMKAGERKTYLWCLNWGMERTSLHAHCSGILPHSPVRISQKEKAQHVLKCIHNHNNFLRPSQFL